MIIHYIGLGKMGKQMVLRLLERGHEVHAWNRSPEPRVEVAAAGAHVYETVEELLQSKAASCKLQAASNNPGTEEILHHAESRSLQLIANSSSPPRLIWLMLPAGEPMRSIIEQIAPLLAPDDIVIDGANGLYKDAPIYAQMLKAYGVHYIDVGVSGGPGGARTGACLMIGGTKAIQEVLDPLFRDLAADGTAYRFFEGVGAGHFTKMVHNGIEYGMMQAIAEGFTILKESAFHIDLLKAGEIYQRRSVIESRLVQWTLDGLRQYGPELIDISGKIGDLGEGKWTIDTAREMSIPVPIIEASYQYRLDSRTRPSYTGKLVSLMRTMFGGHNVKAAI